MKNYKKILIFPRYDLKGASSRTRFYNYFKYLKDSINQDKINALFNKDYLALIYSEKHKSILYKIYLITKLYLKRFIFIIKNSFKNDIFWVEKELFPFLPWALEKYFYKRKKLILDLDDNWSLRYTQHSNPIIRFLLKDKFDQLIKEASVIITGNLYLKEWVERNDVSASIYYIPTCVELPKKLAPLVNSSPVIIGWIGTPSTEKYLSLIKNSLEQLNDKYDIELHIMGAAARPEINMPVKFFKWDLKDEERFLNLIDIGLMPLFDSLWEKGKSGYKLIQYMSYGKPVVGTSIGINKDIIQDTVNGFHADSENDWYEKLELLIVNENLRYQMGSQGYKIVKKKYALNINAKILLKIFKDI